VPAVARRGFPRQAALISGLSQWTVRHKLVGGGLVDAKMYGRNILVRLASLLRYLESLPSRPRKRKA
jgi:hypothetical protein